VRSFLGCGQKGRSGGRGSVGGGGGGGFFRGRWLGVVFVSGLGGGVPGYNIPPLLGWIRGRVFPFPTFFGLRYACAEEGGGMGRKVEGGGEKGGVPCSQLGLLEQGKNST